MQRRHLLTTASSVALAAVTAGCLVDGDGTAPDDSDDDTDEVDRSVDGAWTLRDGPLTVRVPTRTPDSGRLRYVDAIARDDTPYVDAIARDDTPYVDALRAAPHDGREYFGRTGFRDAAAVDTPLGEGVRVRRVHATADHELDTATLVRLDGDHAVALVDVALRNASDERVTVNTPPGFVARGVGVGDATLADPGDHYRLAVQDHRREPRGEAGQWTPVSFREGLPVVTAFDGDRAVSTALYPSLSTTGAEHATTSTNRQQIRLMASKVALAPGASARWRLGVSVHDGGPDAPTRSMETLAVAGDRLRDAVSDASRTATEG